MASTKPTSERTVAVDSRDAPDGDRLAFWRQFLTNSDSVELVSFEENFVGQLKRLTLGDCTLFEANVETPHKLIRAKHPGVCVASIHLRAGNGTFRGRREHPLRAGELTVYDISDYELEYRSGMTILGFAIPRAKLEPHVANLSAVFGEDLHCNKLLVTSLGLLCQRLLAGDEGLSPAVNDNLASSVTSLLAATLQDASESLPQASTWSQRALLQRVKIFIREHLEQPDLSPAIVAKAVGISVGYLHRLFKLEDSSVMRFVLSERLDRARIRLRRVDESIGQAAFSVGFSASAHFARAFRDKFGVSPREYKRQVMRQSR